MELSQQNILEAQIQQLRDRLAAMPLPGVATAPAPVSVPAPIDLPKAKHMLADPLLLAKMQREHPKETAEKLNRYFEKKRAKIR